MLRRDFLRGAAAVPAAALASQRHLFGQVPWDKGELLHLLPTVSDSRISLKFSTREGLASPPHLRMGSSLVTATATDTQGRFWRVDVSGLDPATEYGLALENAGGSPLSDPWTLATFPDRSDSPERVRLFVYTCAGGRNLPMATKHRLLDRGMSFGPDAMIAIGDHVYWDLRRTGAGSSPASIEFAGRFDRTIPVLGTSNENSLKRVVDSQVAELYGTRFRSTPVFFLQDDHDYFENDHADEEIVTFPPDHFMLQLARASQSLYYPEFLPDPDRAAGLPGAAAEDRPSGINESFGSLRYGRLLEILLYDCRRFMTLKGPTATFVPSEVEAWLVARMAAEDTSNIVNLPSTPVGWTAGKWGEWYPDILDDQGVLTDRNPKFLWQEGWRSQHDRLLTATADMTGIPLWVSGDLHSLGETHIQQTRELDLRHNPIVSILSGPLGTGRGGWPSTFRGTRALTPNSLDVDERLPALEENGFILMDVEADRTVIRFFRWNNREDPPEAIDSLEPFRVTELTRRA